MLERLLLTAGLAVLGWAVYLALNAILLRRRAQQALGLPDYQPGRPAILYFTSPGCVPCRTIQRPALAELIERFGERLQVIEVNCADDRELAIEWGVLSVPTTFLIDAAGRARGVNHGVTRAPKLIEQLTAIGAPPPEPPMGKEQAGEGAPRPAAIDGR